MKQSILLLTVYCACLISCQVKEKTDQKLLNSVVQSLDPCAGQTMFPNYGTGYSYAIGTIDYWDTVKIGTKGDTLSGIKGLDSMTFITHITLFAYATLNTTSINDSIAYYLIAITDSQMQPGGLVKADKESTVGCYYYQVYSYVNTFTPMDASGEKDLTKDINQIKNVVTPAKAENLSNDSIYTEISIGSFQLFCSTGSGAAANQTISTQTFEPSYLCQLTDPGLIYYTIEAPTQIGDHPFRQASTYETSSSGIQKCVVAPDPGEIIFCPEADQYSSQSNTVSMETTAGWIYDGKLISNDQTLKTAIEVKYFWKVRQNPPGDNIPACAYPTTVSDYDDYPVTFTTPVFDLVELTQFKDSPPSPGL